MALYSPLRLNADEGIVLVSFGSTVKHWLGGERERERERERDRESERERERERENSNSKTLFYKDCSLVSVKNLTTSPC